MKNCHKSRRTIEQAYEDQKAEEAWASVITQTRAHGKIAEVRELMEVSLIKYWSKNLHLQYKRHFFWSFEIGIVLDCLENYQPKLSLQKASHKAMILFCASMTALQEDTFSSSNRS